MMSRKIAFANSVAVGVMAVSFGTSAPAADFQRRPPPPPIVVPPWAGFYIGAHVGTMTSSDDINGAGWSAGGINPSGGIGGLQVGYNYQLLPHWLIGIEGESTWTSASATSSDTFFHIKHNWYGTLDGRLGYVLPGNWGWVPGGLLVYAKGGAAWMNGDYSSDPNPTDGIGNTSLTRSGWNIGVGAEYLVVPHWSVKAEYLHLDFKREEFLPWVWAGDTQVEQFKVGVNYHFAPGLLFGRW